jgi:TonB family protein
VGLSADEVTIPGIVSDNKPIEPASSKRKNLWQRLSTGERVSSVIGLISLLLASLVVPEVRYFLHLEKRPEEHTVQPPYNTQPEAQPSTHPKPDDTQPTKPGLRYVPLPNAVPLNDEHRELMTQTPNEGDKQWKTVSINGETLAVVSSKDLDAYLLQKVEPSGFIKLNQGEDVQLYVGIGKDGAVKDVQVISGDATFAEGAKDAVKQWKFKPFTEHGDPVAVQTVIDFGKKSDSEKQ